MRNIVLTDVWLKESRWLLDLTLVRRPRKPQGRLFRKLDNGQAGYEDGISGGVSIMSTDLNEGLCAVLAASSRLV